MGPFDFNGDGNLDFSERAFRDELFSGGFDGDFEGDSGMWDDEDDEDDEDSEDDEEDEDEDDEDEYEDDECDDYFDEENDYNVDNVTEGEDLMESYEKEEKELKKHIDVMDKTFSRYGLKVGKIGVEYADMFGGPGIRFFIEVMSQNQVDATGSVKLKVNVYDSDDELISMDEEEIDLKKFSGFDTYKVTVFHDTIHDNAKSARVYLTN